MQNTYQDLITEIQNKNPGISPRLEGGKKFEIKTDFKPAGDQPEAIKQLINGVNKEQLRIDVKQATTEYLKTKTIQYQNDSPNGKVQSVGIRELGSYSDSAEFYYLEESLDNNPLTS